jgi:hypothetical protein
VVAKLSQIQAYLVMAQVALAVIAGVILVAGIKV